MEILSIHSFLLHKAGHTHSTHNDYTFCVYKHIPSTSTQKHFIILFEMKEKNETKNDGSYHAPGPTILCGVYVAFRNVHVDNIFFLL